MKRSILLIPLLLVFFSFINTDQAKTGSVKVYITDENGDDFLGCNVKLLANNVFVKGNATDPFGLATIANLDPGKYILEVSAIGYAVHKEFITVRSSKVTSVNVKLQVQTHGLDEVLIKERTPLIKEPYGGMSSKANRLPVRGSTGVVTTAGGVTSTSGSMPVIRGGRAGQTISYIDGMPVRGKSKNHVVVEKGFSKTLTAGELNDFNKFDLWKHLSSSLLNSYVSEWKVDLKERYAICLKNAESGAVINAKVHLIGKDDKRVWTGVTNNAGRVELWGQFGMNEANHGISKIEIEYAGEVFTCEQPILYKDGINQIKLPVSCYQPSNVDIAFVVDATGSMHDEINYLKDEMGNIINRFKDNFEGLNIRTASVFYKDYNQEYLTVKNDFTESTDEIVSFINSKSAGGGGSDYMEAVDTALLTAIRSLKWQKEARTRVLFLMLDAPPHKDKNSLANMKTAIRLAAKKGIRIVPVVCSGSDKSNEFIMRTTALATNGTYLFLTDHSGVGGSHLKPSTDSYDVNYLNDLLFDVLSRFTMLPDCGSEMKEPIPALKSIATETNDSIAEATNKLIKDVSDVLAIKKIKTTGELDKSENKKDYDNSLIQEGTSFSLFPNPAVNTLNISSNSKPKRVLLLDGSGKMLREFSKPSANFSISLTDYSSGIYFVALIDGNDKSKVERFIVKK